MKLWRRLAAGGLLIAIALLSSCGSSSDNPAGPNPPGGTLELNSQNIGAGGVFEHTFAVAGTFPYHCNIHSAMTGSVTVSSGGPATASVSIANSTSSGFQPGTVTVGIGGKVTWTNNDNTAHTVTSH